MSVRVEDHWGEFLRKHDKACDMAVGLMAADIETLAKQKVPIKMGELMASIRHKREGQAHFIVGAGQNGPAQAYARYQEFGGDDKRTVRNYTKGGTGAHYLGDSGDIVSEKHEAYFKTAMSANGIG